ncbi:hypothetical protein [Kitasatospora sp. MBT63]|uniref:ISAzo13-like element transposase-related protein n=1 Tax=Kitasatospora sp. MBT63 TaxID=1444768 RepID=UPI0034CD61E6
MAARTSRPRHSAEPCPNGSTIRRWWNAAGRSAYSNAGRPLITADAGGSNGYRTRG